MIPHEFNLYAKEYEIANAIVCAYPQSDHELPHLKCVLRCFSDCSCNSFPNQETDNQYS